MYRSETIECLLIEYLKKNKSETEIIEFLKGEGLYTVFNISPENEKINKIINIYQRKIVLEIIKRFDQEHIEYIWFKGMVLSKLLYENELSRKSGDVDIYVAPDDFDKAYNIIKKMGFYVYDENDKLNSHHLVMCNGRVFIELHHNIISPMINIEEGYLLSHLSSETINGSNIKTFDITATFLHLLYHLYMDTYLSFSNLQPLFERLEYPKTKKFIFRAYEIALFAKKYGDEINWLDIENDIISQLLKYEFRVMIYDIESIFPNTLPQHFLNIIWNLKFVVDENNKFCTLLTDVTQTSSAPPWTICVSL